MAEKGANEIIKACFNARFLKQANTLQEIKTQSVEDFSSLSLFRYVRYAANIIGTTTIHKMS